MKYQPIIGLEIHIELNTDSKMFCSCFNNSEETNPNFNICPVCMAHPGTLPVINKEAVRKVIKTGLALGCKIPEYSKFDRKNYFYPDLPKGYQISQYDFPLCKGGFLKIKDKTIKITRVHLEEDTGKLIHPKGKDYSLVDFNRAGIPLMELVTEPDMRSSKQAKEFAKELQLILRYLKVSKADMEKGELRVEANISLITENSKSKTSGTKVEVKNLNSFKILEKALEYEIERQTDVLKSGKKVIHETRGWDESKGETVSQREKEKAHDYRYFSEPDLPILRFKKKEIKEIESEIPELPQQKRKRFQKEYKLSLKEVNVFVQNKDFGEYFEKIISELINWAKDLKIKEYDKLTKTASNYLLTDFLGLLKNKQFIEKDILISPENFAEFIILIHKGEISSKIAKEVLLEMFKKGRDPSYIIKEKGLEQISDGAEIEKIIKIVISKNEKVVQDFKKGKGNAIQFLVGQVMAATRGKADPVIVNEILKKLVN